MLSHRGSHRGAIIVKVESSYWGLTRSLHPQWVPLSSKDHTDNFLWVERRDALCQYQIREERDSRPTLLKVLSVKTTPISRPRRAQEPHHD